MKKFAIGCLGVLVVVAVLGGGIVWFKVIKPGVEMAGEFVQMGQEIEKLEQGVENQAAFDPPASGVLDETSFQRFLAAQRQMVATLEGRLKELEAKYEALDQQLNDGGNPAELVKALGAWKDMTGLLLDAKRAQVEALNAHGFSLGEYAWVREQVYAALGRSVAVAALAGQDFKATGKLPDVAPETVELVEPYRQELLESHALAWWGL